MDGLRARLGRLLRWPALPGIVFGALALGGLGAALVIGSDESRGAASLLVRARLLVLAADSASGAGASTVTSTPTYTFTPVPTVMIPGGGGGPGVPDTSTPTPTPTPTRTNTPTATPTTPAPPVNQRPVVNAGPDQVVAFPATVVLTGSATDDGPLASLTYVWSSVSGPGTVSFANATSASTTATFSGPGVYVLRLTVSDGFLSGTDDVQVTLSLPILAAPLVTNTTNTDVGAATSFLYTGPNAVQTGVTPGAIVRARAAVVRGLVTERDSGGPLAGVRVSILDHPEWGQTVTRADGMFDLAVNSDGYLNITYARAGYIGAQRQVFVAPQSYVVAPDVALVKFDTASTIIDLSAPGMKVARARVQSDADGTRRATLLVPEGTTAGLVPPVGPAAPRTSLTIRMTEFTVGPNGPAAMPADLPPTSKYTYALDLNADEALAAGAIGVEFNQPLPFYVEDFLGFPVGVDAPLGYFDRRQGFWVPLPSGRVVKIISITAGAADLDIDGDGLADNAAALATLQITDAERTSLATLYAAGQVLWRVQVPHFSIMDINWAKAATDLEALKDQAAELIDQLLSPKHCSICDGSSIELENQVLGETIGLTGVPSALNYSSATQQNPKAVLITVTGASLPADLLGVEVTIEVAGRVQRRTFPALPNQTWTFEWDGLDAYGRRLSGAQSAQVKIDNLFRESYAGTSRFGGIPFTAGSIGSPGPIRAAGHISKRFDVRVVAPWALGGPALGGWTLSQHHVYDPAGKTVYLGTGDRIEDKDALGGELSTSLGHGSISPHQAPPGTPAELLSTSGLNLLTTASGGGYWTTSFGRLVRVDGDNLATVVSGDLGAIRDIVEGPRGEVFIANDYGRILRFDIATRALTTLVEANGQCRGPNPLMAPILGTLFNLCTFPRIAAAADGSLYVTDQYTGRDGAYRRIYRLTRDGILSPFALSEPLCPFYPDAFFNGGWCGFDLPAAQAAIGGGMGGIWAGADGSLYAHAGAPREEIIVRIGADGILRRYLGDGPGRGDGIPVGDVGFTYLRAFAAGPDGRLAYFHHGGRADEGDGYRVRTIINGTVLNVAGNGYAPGQPGLFDGLPATQASISTGYQGYIAFGADGDIYFYEGSFIRKISSRVRGFGNISDHFIPSPDGSEVWRFDGVGRHLQTLHALTGAVLWSFGYDSEGRLSTMTDGDGNVTSVTRNAGGHATGITGPFGQTTTLATGADGRLTTVTNPNAETVTLGYSAAGLLASKTTPRGQTHTFVYNAAGDLRTDANPAGGSQTLGRTDLGATATRAAGRQVTRSTILGRTTGAVVEFLKNGERKQSTAAPDGTTTRTTYDNGLSTTTAPTGASATLIETPDPRFGLQAPLTSGTVTNTPGGLTLTATTTQSAVLSDPANPFSLVTLTGTSTLNGRTAQTIYDGATRTFSGTSPAGRTSSYTIDSLGKVTASSVPGLAGTTAVYDARGRLSTTTTGTGGTARTTTFTYNAQSFLQNVTDPIGRVVWFEYDAAGRVTKQTLPDGREIVFAYDANGNLTSLTPPGKPAHTFTYNQVDRPTAYVPPSLVAGPGSTTYAYNLDQQPVTETRPDGLVTTLAYDSAGRLDTMTFSRGIVTFSYSLTTGQLTGITAPDGENLAYTYLGQLLTQETWTGPVSGGVSGAVGWGYDNDFRLTSQTVNGANAAAYVYDADSLLTSAGALTLARNASNGLLTGTTLDTITDTWTRNLFAEATAYSVSAGVTALYGTSYTRDNVGRISSKTETIEGVSHTYDYSYDVTGRLIGVKNDSVAVAAYTYDSNGNRLSGPSLITPPTYDAQDRMLTYGLNAYAYNLAGDLVSKTNIGGTTTYTFDQFGNLTRVVRPAAAPVIDYVIDGANRRVGKKVGGVLQQGWLYDGSLAIVAELNGSGTLVSRFVYATHANIPDYLVQGGVTYRVVTDHLGSLRLVVRADDGTVVQRMNHDEFGNVTLDVVAGGFTRIPFGFAGGLYDADTALVRFGARDYDPETGRWTAKDPAGVEAGTNVYEYAGHDPVNFADLNGLDPTQATVTNTPAGAVVTSVGPGYSSLQVDGQVLMVRGKVRLEKISMANPGGGRRSTMWVRGISKNSFAMLINPRTGGATVYDCDVFARLRATGKVLVADLFGELQGLQGYKAYLIAPGDESSGFSYAVGGRGAGNRVVQVQRSAGGPVTIMTGDLAP